jgi:hypothetical protein
MTRLTLLGVGAMRSPRYAPAGLLIEHGRDRVMIDGGAGAEPTGSLSAWLVTDARCEEMRNIRALARRRGVEPEVRALDRGVTFRVTPRPVIHTSHPTFGYELDVDGQRIAWAPEFFELPSWIDDFDLVFAEAAGFRSPIRFAGGVGGHASLVSVAEEAQRRGVRRLVFAHIGRPTIRAMDAGERPPFGEMGHDGQVFTLTSPRTRGPAARGWGRSVRTRPRP